MIDEKHEASFNNMMKNERIRIMKKTKLFLSVMLALIMTLAMAVPVFADNGLGTLTIENTNDGYTYTAVAYTHLAGMPPTPKLSMMIQSYALKISSNKAGEMPGVSFRRNTLEFSLS